MIIAKIKLSPGNVGWYDPLTNTHLTIANPYAEVKAGANLTNIKKGVAFRTLQLIEGSLEEEEIIEQIEQTRAQVANLSVEPTQEPVILEDVAEETVEAPAKEKVAPKETKAKKTSTTKAKA